MQTLNPALRVIGVQSDAAPAAFRSWRDLALLEDEMRTFAEGLATRVAFELPQRIMWELLDDFVLVSDDEGCGCCVNLWNVDGPEEALSELFAISEDPAIIYEHEWKLGDLVVWDNWASIHARKDFPREEPRLMRRLTIEGQAMRF